MSEPRVDLRFIITAIRKFWWLVLLMVIVGGAGAFGYGMLQTPQYRATSSVHFALERGGSAIDLNQGSVYTQSQMLSFAQLVEGSRVLQPVIDDLGLDVTPHQLGQSIDVTIPQDTVTMQITATSADPQRAADLSTAVSEQLMEEIQEVAPKNAKGESTITATIYDDAVPPAHQSSPNKLKEGLLGALVGGVVGLAAALLITLLDTRVRTEEALAETGMYPVLGVITKDPLLADRSIAVAREPVSHVAEDFRRLQSALTYANVTSPVHILLVTAGMPGEGKSTISANFAMTLASNDHSVLLIDADLRRPRAHEHAGVDGSVGLTGVLLDEVDVEAATHSVQGTSLDVLAAGRIPPNPAEMLTSERMATLLSAMAEKYAFIVIDSPPALSVADAGLLAPLVDGVILTVDATRTRRAELTKSMKLLESGGARILGTVLNRAKPDGRRDGYYGEQ